MPGNQTHHYTWAMRWTGQHLPKPQGLRPDGLPTAALSFVAAVKAELARARMNKLEENKLRLHYGGQEWIRLQIWFKKLRKTKPYALTVAMAVYTTLGLLGWILVGPPALELLARIKRWNVPCVLTNILP